jgi:hypothetical protein
MILKKKSIYNDGNIALECIYIYIYLDGPPLIIRSRVNAPLPSLRAGPARPPSIFCRGGGHLYKGCWSHVFCTDW